MRLLSSQYYWVCMYVFLNSWKRSGAKLLFLLLTCKGIFLLFIPCSKCYLLPLSNLYLASFFLPRLYLLCSILIYFQYFSLLEGFVLSGQKEFQLVHFNSFENPKHFLLWSCGILENSLPILWAVLKWACWDFRWVLMAFGVPLALSTVTFLSSFS